MVTLAVDRYLFRQLKSADLLIGVIENDPIPRLEIPILALPERGKKETLRSCTKICFTCVRDRSLHALASQAHITREDHLYIKGLDFEI